MITTEQMKDLLKEASEMAEEEGDTEIAAIINDVHIHFERYSHTMLKYDVLIALVRKGMEAGK